jgi:hypothetical protein
MILTPEIMRALGSGADPSDEKCLRGYQIFKDEFDRNNNTIPVTHGNVMKRFKFLIDNGETDRTEGLIFLRWFSLLKSNPKALRLGGYAKEMDIGRFDGVEYISLSDAVASRQEKISSIKNRPFDHVNVLRHIPSGNGLVTASVKCMEQISPADRVTVFDPETGLHNDAKDVLSDVERVSEIILARVPKVERKIKDTQEGFEAWEVLP